MREGVQLDSDVRARTVEISGIALIPRGLLLDDGETGDAVERIWLHFEPGIGNFLVASCTDSIRMPLQGGERLLDPAKFFEGEQFHGQGDIVLMLGGGLIEWVGKEFWLCGDQMRHHGFVCKHHSESIQFVLKVRVILALPHGGVRTLG